VNVIRIAELASESVLESLKWLAFFSPFFFKPFRSPCWSLVPFNATPFRWRWWMHERDWERDSWPHYTWRSTNTVSRILEVSFNRGCNDQNLWDSYRVTIMVPPLSMDVSLMSITLSLYPSKNRMQERVLWVSRSIQQKMVCALWRSHLRRHFCHKFSQKVRRTVARLTKSQ